jgi:hypothetical protein
LDDKASVVERDGGSDVVEERDEGRGDDLGSEGEEERGHRTVVLEVYRLWVSL